MCESSLKPNAIALESVESQINLFSFFCIVETGRMGVWQIHGVYSFYGLFKHIIADIEMLEQAKFESEAPKSIILISITTSTFFWLN